MLNNDDLLINLERLARLRDKGIITPREFAIEKKQILGKLNRDEVSAESAVPILTPPAPRNLSFKEQFRVNNEAFKRRMAENNAQFKANMKKTGRPNDDSKVVPIVKAATPLPYRSWSKRPWMIVGAVLAIVTGLSMASTDDGREALLGIVMFCSIALLVIGLMRPLKLRRLVGEKVSRARIAMTMIAVFIVTIVVFDIIFEPSFNNVSIKDGMETTEEILTISGEVIGSSQLRLGDEVLPVANGHFERVVKLNPGDNEFILSVLKNGKEYQKQGYKIFFDYEGKLYADQIKAEKAELDKRLSTIPAYEVMRKDGDNQAYSAVIYMDGASEEYKVSNVVADAKRKHGAKKISILAFDKADKNTVEAAWESNSPPALDIIAAKTRANYEKNEGGEELFFFPSGVGGEKLALEIK